MAQLTAVRTTKFWYIVSIKRQTKNNKFLTLADFEFSYDRAEIFKLFQNLLEKNSAEFFTIGLSKNKISYPP